MKIARKFGVAETTLRRAIANGTVPKRSGPETVLTEYEERELAGYALNMQQLGFGLTKPAINTKIMEIIHRKNRQHPFNGQPGRKWWNRFMKNNPQLSFRVPQALTEARAQRANPIIVRDHFQKLNEIFKQHSLTADRIWNMDETGFNIESRLEKVLAKKGSQQVYKFHLVMITVIYLFVRLFQLQAPIFHRLLFTKAKWYLREYLREHQQEQYVHSLIRAICRKAFFDNISNISSSRYHPLDHFY